MSQSQCAEYYLRACLAFEKLFFSVFESKFTISGSIFGRDLFQPLQRLVPSHRAAHQHSSQRGGGSHGVASQVQQAHYHERVRR